MQSDVAKKFLTISEAARLLGVTRQTVHAWTQADKGPRYLQFSDRKKIYADDVAAMLYFRERWHCWPHRVRADDWRESMDPYLHLAARTR